MPQYLYKKYRVLFLKIKSIDTDPLEYRIKKYSTFTTTNTKPNEKEKYTRIH
jgi:hypothetical protein